ncbi:MAG: glucan 1,4-alpha-glucosidase [Bryobacterales bacterium]|nr:glucan 1,4-alpha-glucosidase [Bryobacterales bacterium]
MGTALSAASRLWFTISHGILNEVYYPRLDSACTRDFGLIVTDGAGFFSEEKRHARSIVQYLEPGVPAYRLINRCKEGRYEIVKEVIADPACDTLLQRIRFRPLQPSAGYRLYALLAPHLGNCGGRNTAWTGDYKGNPILFAERDGYALALACTAPWLAGSAGYAGFSDGWQDLVRHKRLTCCYARAEDGNVALTGEVDWQTAGGCFELALGFGTDPEEAAQHALASLAEGFENVCREYVRTWQAWQQKLCLPAGDRPGQLDTGRVSAMVLRTHEAKTGPGGLIASLSIPWGFAKGDEDLGGYHLVWPRDLVEAAGGLLAAGAHEDAIRVLRYLEVTQEADGHWSQNMWLNGTPFWNHVQMDETALPVLLVELALREGALGGESLRRFWPMVRKAAAYLVRNGPVTQQDRWEQDPGYSPFTLAAEVAALLAAADLAEGNGEIEPARYLRETADYWNANIERWIYVTGTSLCEQVGVDGYYVRIAPPEISEAASPQGGFVPIKNRVPPRTAAAELVVSPDALALVRFGLRSPDDPRLLNTVKVIDAVLRVETPLGPVWRRYNEDRYGEKEDGSPFDGSGTGRPWPLLTGERAHYELAAGRRDRAGECLRVLESLASDGGMIPEQVWDAGDIPERELFFGRPSGSAMPLVWAHAEHLKLRRSLRDGRVFDTPVSTVQRYQVERICTPFGVWRFNQRTGSIPRGRVLRVEVLSAAAVHWSPDGWATVHDSSTRDTGLGVHVADLDTQHLPEGARVLFTFFWPEANRWEGTDFEVRVA